MIASDEQLASPIDLAIGNPEQFSVLKESHIKTFLSNGKGMAHIFFSAICVS